MVRSGRWVGLGLGMLVVVVSAAGTVRAQVPFDETECDGPGDQAEAGVAAGAAAEPAAGAGEVPTVGLAEIDRAGLYFRAGGGRFVPAPALDAEVDIRVSGLISRARVTQRFANASNAWVEGVYVFPLPETAAVDGLRLVVGGRVIEGQIQERQQAKRTYEEARSAGVKASLVEQERPNLFTTSVANVGPGERIEVTIDLQQTVDYDAGAFRLRFPLVLTPRYVPPGPPPEPSLAEPGLGWGAATAAVPDAARITPPMDCAEPAEGFVSAVTAAVGAQLGPGVHRLAHGVMAAADRLGASIPGLEPGPDHPLRLSVDIDAGVPLDTVASPYHDFSVVPSGPGRYRVELDGGVTETDRDFELSWTPRAGAEPEAALFTERRSGDVYALLMVLPPAPGTAVEAPPREVVFVLDTSGSMHGGSLEQAKAALVDALARLRPEDTFNVIEFNSVTRALFPGSLPPMPAVVEEARRWVLGRQADGGTEMLPALAAALEPPDPGYRQPSGFGLKQVVFITDGAVGNEDELFAAIDEMLGDARLFTVGIGSAPNSHFMRRAAEAGRGTFTYIGHPGEVAEKMAALFAKLESPVVTDLEVVWDDPGAEVWPPRVPDLYAGEPLVVAARLAGLGDRVVVRGTRDGVPWERTLAVAGLTGGRESGVGKLWARRKIAALESGAVPGVAGEGIRPAVIDVALAHHLVSRFTSLVAVDVTPSRPGAEPLHSRAVPSPLPDGQVGELPVGGTASRLELALGLALLLPALLAGLAALGGLRRRTAAVTLRRAG